MHGIVFLDRDGTLIRDTGYPSDPDQVELIPGAVEGVRLLNEAGFTVAVVSNQSGLARGKFTEAQFESVHDRFLALFREAGARFDAAEYCPHHPQGTVVKYAVACGCRKPETGLADRILARFPESAAWSRWVVGDKLIDVELGTRLGARTVLVATGYGASEFHRTEGCAIRPDAFLPDMKEAARWIVSESRK